MYMFLCDKPVGNGRMNVLLEGFQVLVPVVLKLCMHVMCSLSGVRMYTHKHQ